MMRLASFTDDYTMTVGGKKLSGHWKWKAFVEAGWGDEPSSAVGGSGTPGDPEQPK